MAGGNARREQVLEGTADRLDDLLLVIILIAAARVRMRVRGTQQDLRQPEFSLQAEIKCSLV